MTLGLYRNCSAEVCVVLGQGVGAEQSLDLLSLRCLDAAGR